ncbi:MAG TPA: cytochrome c oxidase subunit II [Vicinamibacterales bacterium]|nr:cytochrome c oxidase subunit II [Vicinamibacterales bacterium]
MRCRVAPALAAALAFASAVAMAQGRPTVVPGMHDALVAAGPQSGHIGALWNVILAVCAFVFCAILLGLVVALWRSGRGDATTRADVSMLARHERGSYLGVLWAVAVSTALLLAMLVASVLTDRALARLSLVDAVHVEVTAHQWWWELQYSGSPESARFTTANELHVPVGRPVVLTLKADDVIHSFWVPSLAGKKDLIPGRTTTLHLRADQAGRYRGQCAEFCGFQHAFMAFEVIADPPERFEAWMAGQRRPASEPADATTRRGQEVFLRSTCVLCHAIEGTAAAARKAPDLTHVGARTTLAAGTLPNGETEMQRWIADPQRLKPGVNMPAATLPAADLAALAAYLVSLK